MADASRHDDWASGDSYDAYIGRWSRGIAPLFLDFVGAGSGLRWLDVGCGTGALSQAIFEHSEPADLIGVEPAEPFRERARAVVPDPRARFEAGDAAALPLDDGSRDITVSGLVLNFVPDRNKMLAEMKRVTATGGTVAFYVWDYAGGGLELLRAFWDAAAALNPAAEEFAEAKRFPWCEPAFLTALAHEAGLGDVRVEAVETPSVFRDFDDYWRPFTLGTGPAPGYYKKLAEVDREALRARLDSGLPRDTDGSIPMVARAWAVSGRV
jgi:SAM-dependent methyltransferase